MTRAPAPAKINLSLVVGPAREDGKHEVVTVYQRIALSDRITVERSPELSVAGFPGDTLVRRALEGVKRPRDLATLPPNDLASSPLARELVALGAFRADVTGAGPTVYGLFLHGHQARAAQKRISPEGRTWLTAPAWYR